MSHWIASSPKVSPQTFSPTWEWREIPLSYTHKQTHTPLPQLFNLVQANSSQIRGLWSTGMVGAPTLSLTTDRYLDHSPYFSHSSHLFFPILSSLFASLSCPAESAKPFTVLHAAAWSLTLTGLIARLSWGLSHSHCQKRWAQSIAVACLWFLGLNTLGYLWGENLAPFYRLK